MAFLLERQANPPCPSNAQQTLGDHVAEQRTPARQSDDTQCSGVLFSLDIAQWRWVCGGGEHSRVWVRGQTRTHWGTGAIVVRRHVRGNMLLAACCTTVLLWINVI